MTGILGIVWDWYGKHWVWITETIMENTIINFSFKCTVKSHVKALAQVPERPICTNPGLKNVFHFCIYLPMHSLD